MSCRLQGPVLLSQWEVRPAGAVPRLQLLPRLWKKLASSRRFRGLRTAYWVCSRPVQPGV